MANVIFFYAFLVLCCVYALIRGGAPERVGAGIIIGGTLLTGMAASSARPAFVAMEAGILVVDAGMFLAALLLAARARRFWPLWMTGLLAVQVAGHAARLASPEMMPWAYSVAQGIWSYPIIALVAVGAWRHQTRIKRGGADSSWVSSSLPSTR